MATVMYNLGGYVFASDTAVPRTVSRDTRYNWATQNRLNREPAQQAISYGTDTLKFNGVMYPCDSRSGKEQIEYLRLYADQMIPLVLSDGEGTVYGRWVVKSINESRSHLWQDSDPRKVSFSVDLEAYGEDYLSIFFYL